MGGNEDLSTLAIEREVGFYIVKGNCFKFYPCGNGLQSAIQASLELVKECGFTHDQVESVEEIFNRPHYIVCTKDGVTYTPPKTGLEAKFVVPYGITAALIDQKVTVETFADEMVLRPEVQQLLGKITTRIDATREKEHLTVRLKDGTRYDKDIEMPKGHWTRPLPTEDIIAKYQYCAGRALPREAGERSLEILKHLEDLDNINELTRLVTG